MEKIFLNQRIGFDMDNVMTNWQKAAQDYMLTHLPYVPFVKKEDQKQWHFEQNYPEKFSVEIAKMYMNPESGFYLNMEPMPGAIKTLRKISKMGGIITIVSSPLPFGKEQDLSFYGNDPAKQVEVWARIVREKALWLARHAPEFVTCFMPHHHKESYGGEYLVDDRPNAAKGKKSSWKQIVFSDNYGWVTENMNPTANWDNMIEVLHSLINKSLSPEKDNRTLDSGHC